MKKIFYIFILSLLFTASSHAGDCRKIIVTSDPDYPPISWQDKQHPDKIIGVAIELVERLFAEKGIVVESKYMGPWKRVAADIGKDDIDMISGIYLNEERKTFLDYVYPAFMSDPSVVFVKKGAVFPFEKREDLKGRIGGVRLGDSFGSEFDDFSRRSLSLEQVGSAQQLFKMMDVGRIEYFVYGLYSGWALAEELDFKDKVEVLSKPVSNEGIYIAFYKNSKCAIYSDFLSQKIPEVISIGLPQFLVEKYQKIWAEQKKGGLKQ